MKFLPMIALVVALVALVHTFWLANRIAARLSSTEADNATFERDSEAASAELERLAEDNTSEIKAVREKAASGVENLELRLNELEIELRDEVSSKLTQELVEEATSMAIEKVVSSHLPKSSDFLLDLAGVLAKNFHKELQGVPGEKVDPELLATFLARDQSFLDALQFKTLTEFDSSDTDER
ncbi:hypothetical protein IMCC3135_10075 [Granulosicoccus antarcticus IMCC3135]|uniref:Uncharacterized protein n=2 Tax=Granulosicoccus TaxID=437504 RepID=A0A2Z2NLR6_9GAMM|nr:hypothetical protein IMCC3135_10075 [Granulosicoccus antarcticus IMCC3135]